MKGPHFKVVASELMGNRTQVYVVDGETEIDISELISGITVRISMREANRISFETPFATVDVIGQLQTHDLDRLISIGQYAKTMRNHQAKTADA